MPTKIDYDRSECSKKAVLAVDFLTERIQSKQAFKKINLLLDVELIVQDSTTRV